MVCTSWFLIISKVRNLKFMRECHLETLDLFDGFASYRYVVNIHKDQHNDLALFLEDIKAVVSLAFLETKLSHDVIKFGFPLPPRLFQSV